MSRATPWSKNCVKSIKKSWKVDSLIKFTQKDQLEKTLLKVNSNWFFCFKWKESAAKTTYQNSFATLPFYGLDVIEKTISC